MSHPRFLIFGENPKGLEDFTKSQLVTVQEYFQKCRENLMEGVWPLSFMCDINRPEQVSIVATELDLSDEDISMLIAKSIKMDKAQKTNYNYSPSRLLSSPWSDFYQSQLGEEAASSPLYLQWK